ncbi:MAG TPA: rhodanese-like domain-containing protein [Albitalea sp.]|uniref:rhodanese-like domain-containing protein n=1 Tax=Piscinibacter sp. TaxID=1903157 RepID=UPI002ED15ECB
MSTLIQLIGQYGFVFLFACVLIEQAGIPVPAYPVLLVAGSMVASGQLSGPGALASAVVACLIADGLWFVCGRRHGVAVLRLICKLSITPDSCVRQTESIFTRFGPRSLTVAKFVPGFATVATAMAGITGVSVRAFLVYGTIGAALWAGVGLAIGHAFAPAVADLLLVLDEMGRWGLVLLAACLALSIAVKVWRRHQLAVRVRMNRISVDALARMLASGDPPLVVDARSAVAQAGGRIPGAILFDGTDWAAALQSADEDPAVVVYCDCPGDTSAALIARKLMERGFRRVHPLSGGMQAWREAGLRVERVEA